MSTSTPETPEQWAIIELMGHIKYGGLLSPNSSMPGLIRIDVPREDGSLVTQFINPSSIYRLTFTDKALATSAALAGDPMPYSSWELKDLLKGKIIEPQPSLPFSFNDDDDDDDDEEPHYGGG